MTRERSGAMPRTSTISETDVEIRNTKNIECSPTPGSRGIRNPFKAIASAVTQPATLLKHQLGNARPV